MKLATIILAITMTAPCIASAQEFFAFDFEQTVSGSTERYQYVFTNRGVVLQTKIPDPNKTAVGLFRYDRESDRIHISWLKLQKPLKTSANETLQFDATKKPITFQIVDHTDAKQKNSVTSVRAFDLPKSQHKAIREFADTAIQLVKANGDWQNQKEREQIELMLEFHRGMNRAGWKYVEQFGKKLGL